MIIVDLVSVTTANTLAGLRSRFQRRGFDHLSNQECNDTLNSAYQEVCDLEDWPFLEADASGVAPLTVADLRKVYTVRDSVQKAWLPRVERDSIIDRGLDVATTGTPAYYYVDAGNIVRTYPVGGTLAVRYWKTPTDLTTDSDVPVIPTRYLDVVVLCACIAAHMNESSPDYQSFTNEYQRRLDVMRQALLAQHAEAARINIVTGGEDY